jgi:4-amino-4-deoxy-L-arabinose transferase-like glycosyltransferase
MSVRVASPRASSPSSWGSWAWAGIVLLVSGFLFGADLRAEPRFADESAYLSQSYFADLWLRGDVQSADWLEYPAIDLPPLPKYVIGLALRVGGYQRPGPEAARAWYLNINTPVGSAEMLDAARWPSVLLGALGCLAVYGLGLLVEGRTVGVIAALLLAINPLYRMHARRAMSDVPTEFFILSTAVVALWAWRRTLAQGWGVGPALVGLAAGALAGLALLSKLSGGLALIIVAAWALLAAVLPRFPLRRKLGVAASSLIAGGIAFLTFVALNPFMFAHPKALLPRQRALAGLAALGLEGRARELIQHRLRVPREQQLIFPDDALRTPLDKVAAVAVQGYGRFGPLGPRLSKSWIRFDREQDWGALIWIPWVGLGVLWAWEKGRRQLGDGEPPTAWALLVQAAVTLTVVTAFLPLAWDRYYLSLQPGAALLAAGAVVAAVDALARRWSGHRKAAEP